MVKLKGKAGVGTGCKTIGAKTREIALNNNKKKDEKKFKKKKSLHYIE